MRVLIAGCGYVGGELARRLAASGHEVTGLRRSPAPIPGATMLAADLFADPVILDPPRALDALVYAVSADRGDEAAYRAAYVTGPERLLAHLRRHGRLPRRLVFLSSTGVYGQQDGEWVDEESVTDPAHFTGDLLLEGERAAAASGVESVTLRLGGIYGPGRTRVIESVRSGEARCAEGEPVWTNRIHRDDAARAIAHLLEIDRPEPLYVGVDREPADQCDVLHWIAQRLGLPPPARRPGPSRDPRDRRSNKRCRSARLLACGFRFDYPTFREGYGALMA